MATLIPTNHLEASPSSILNRKRRRVDVCGGNKTDAFSFAALPPQLLVLAAKYLSFEDLLVLPRVCKAWNTTITNECDLWKNIEIPAWLAPRLSDTGLATLLRLSGNNPLRLDLRGCTNLTGAVFGTLRGSKTLEYVDCRGCGNIQLNVASLFGSLSPILKTSMIDQTQVRAEPFQRLPNFRIAVGKAWHGVVRSLEEWNAFNTGITKSDHAPTGTAAAPPVDFDQDMLLVVSMEGSFAGSFWPKPTPRITVVADVGKAFAVQVNTPITGNAGWIDVIKVKQTTKKVLWYFDHQEHWSDTVHQFKLQPSIGIHDLLLTSDNSTSEAMLFAALRYEVHPGKRLDLFLSSAGSQTKKSSRSTRGSARQLTQNLSNGQLSMLSSLASGVPRDLQEALVREAQFRAFSKAGVGELVKAPKAHRFETPPRSPLPHEEVDMPWADVSRRLSSDSGFSSPDALNSSVSKALSSPSATTTTTTTTTTTPSTPVVTAPTLSVLQLTLKSNVTTKTTAIPPKEKATTVVVASALPPTSVSRPHPHPKQKQRSPLRTDTSLDCTSIVPPELSVSHPISSSTSTSADTTGDVVEVADVDVEAEVHIDAPVALGDVGIGVGIDADTDATSHGKAPLSPSNSDDWESAKQNASDVRRTLHPDADTDTISKVITTTPTSVPQPPLLTQTPDVPVALPPTPQMANAKNKIKKKQILQACKSSAATPPAAKRCAPSPRKDPEIEVEQHDDTRYRLPYMTRWPFVESELLLKFGGKFFFEDPRHKFGRVTTKPSNVRTAAAAGKKQKKKSPKSWLNLRDIEQMSMLMAFDSQCLGNSRVWSEVFAKDICHPSRKRKKITKKESSVLVAVTQSDW